MKKILLIASAFLFTLAGVAQNKQQAAQKAKEVVVHSTIQKADDGTRIVQMPYNPSESAYAKSRSDEEYKVGITQYDLQTNSGIGSRYFRFEDGTIGATWTGGVESAPAFPDRGSFYNYWDGQEWVTPHDQVTRIEQERRGWPSYGPYGDGGEAIFSHASGVAMYTRAVKGEGEWEQTTPVVSTEDNTWPRYCNNNGTIHLLEGYQKQIGDDMVNSVFYSRSKDNGQTWSPQGILLPEIGTDFYSTKAFSADDYIWAEPRNGVIAFALFSSTADLVLMKSTDDGETWQKTIVWEHPIPQFDYTTTAYTDTCVAPNGTGQIAIDDEGKVHMVFGTCATEFREPSDDGSYYYFPNWGHLMYWNEDMDTFTGFSNQYRVLDPNVNELLWENNSLVVFYGLDFDGDFFPLGDGNNEHAYYRQLGPIQGAALAYGEDDKMYAAFSTRDERRIITGEDGASYCATQVFLTRFKYDEGLDEWVQDSDWCTPEEGDMVTENPELDYSGFFRVNGHFLHGKDECIDPQIVVQPGDDPNANMYVFFSVDSKPGLALNGEPSQTEYADNVITMWANTKDFQKPTIPEGNSIEESTAIESNTMEVYPNPVTNGTVNVVVKEASNCVIYNILGQVVAEQRLSSGANTVSVSNLNSGVYFITAGNLTQKLVVK